MNRLYFLFLLLSTAAGALAQSPPYHIKYDHKALRLPGKKFAITLVGPDKKKEGWGHYYVEADSGRYSNGHITLNKSEAYKKYDSVTGRSSSIRYPDDL